MSKQSILIVDDTVSSLLWLAQLMSDEGYEVTCAKSGERAVELLETLVPDLMLLDVSMPGMNGLKLCEHVKRQPKLESVPVLFQSAATDAATKIDGLRAGAADFISKPYQPEEILLRVRTHLELHRLRTSLEHMIEIRTQQLRAEIRERRETEKELRKSRQKLRELGGHLQEIREEDRRHIAREIHDALGQSLTVAQIELRRLESAIANSEGNTDTITDGLRSALTEAANTARSISEELRPGTLDLLGLEPTLENYVRKFSESTNIDCRVHMDLSPEVKLEERVSTAAFRIVQESLTNVVRHAGASQVHLQLVGNEEGLILSVRDNGVGMNAEAAAQKGRFGLQGMEERAEILGGTLMIESDRGSGTTIEVFLPLMECNIDD